MKHVAKVLPTVDEFEKRRRLAVYKRFTQLHWDLMAAAERYTAEESDIEEVVHYSRAMYAFIPKMLDDSFIAGWFARERSAHADS